MNYKTVISVLCITTITACAVDKSEETRVSTIPEPQATIEEVIQANRPDNEQHVSTLPPPVETATREERSRINNQVMHDQVAMHEYDAVSAQQPMSISHYKQAAKGMIMPGNTLNGIRHANEPLYRENYQHFDEQNIMRVVANPVSTFSVDVDTGSYTNMRRWLNQGQLPPQDAVRVEEFINYFDYDYPYPENREQPFQVSTEIAPTPWNANTHLLRIGIQGYKVPREQLPATNLVFLLDVSGSMSSPDKLPLLQKALGLLVSQLDARDSISMVVYAGASGVVLKPTPGNQKAEIMAALQRLQAGGSTNGAAGITLAYQMAQQGFIDGGVNRVILATDGDFNVGLASTEELIDMIQRKRKDGIALTTLGFGSGNYNDHLLEQLADEGNGNYAYIDRLSEARKVLAEELSATLLTIAKDVKIQLEFNPAQVSEYRLIGYENRALNEEDFNNDRVDAGEIGAGHRVTALYEISLVGSGGQRLPERRYSSEDSQPLSATSLADELAHLRIRYKLPGQETSRLIETALMKDDIVNTATDSFNFAASVAAFGQKLRGGTYLETFSYDEIASLARATRENDSHGYRSEFMQLVELAGTLDGAEPVASNDMANR